MEFKKGNLVALKNPNCYPNIYVISNVKNNLKTPYQVAEFFIYKKYGINKTAKKFFVKENEIAHKVNLRPKIAYLIGEVVEKRLLLDYINKKNNSTLGYLSFGALPPESLEVVYYVDDYRTLNYTEAINLYKKSRKKMKACVRYAEDIYIRNFNRYSEYEIKERLRNCEIKVVGGEIKKNIGKDRKIIIRSNIIFDGINYFYTFNHEKIILDSYAILP